MSLIKTVFFFTVILLNLVGCNNQLGTVSTSLVDKGLTFTSAPEPFSISTLKQGNSTADVDWTNSTNAASYAVKYKLAAAPTYTVVSTSPSRPFTLTGLVNGLNYLVVIEAHNNVGMTETAPFAFVGVSDQNPVAANLTPVAANLTPAAFNEDTTSVITLSYTDLESDLAVSCSLAGLTNITITQACACDVAGVCTVGVQGTANTNGAASFTYTVTANGDVSNSATASLTITAVDDPPVVNNITPAAFFEDAQTIITLPYTDVEGDNATACAVSNLTNAAITQACGCTLGVCTVGITSATPGAGSFDFTVTAAGLASNTATATLTVNYACPTGYIEVPGNAVLGTKNFCVMQFEAKSNAGAKSEPAGTPWVSINQTNAQAACTALGAGYDLISNQEWMTIARNAEGLAGNWTSGVVGTGAMFRGHTDSSPNNIVSVADDSDLYDQTGNSAADPIGTGFEQRRTFTLSNGNIIWDFVGNVSEWVDWSLVTGLQSPPSCASEYPELFDFACLDLVANEYRPTLAVILGTEEFGYVSLGTTNGLYRGGVYWDDAYAGPYAMSYISNTSTSSVRGFRCVFRPTTADVAPVAFNRSLSISTKDEIAILRLPFSDANGDDATACNLSNLTNVTVTQACACANGNCTVGVTVPAAGVSSFDFTVTANGVVSNTATASGTSFVCPPNFIEVPGNAALGVRSFCAMKYEAKYVSNLATSQPAGVPENYYGWGGSSRCAAIGSKYDVMSNPEWMTIARNIENVASNWTGAAVGSGKIFVGHSDGVPASMLEVTNPADPYDGTGQSAPSDQRRTLELSNGEVIWDLSGNARESIDWSIRSSHQTYSTYCDQGTFELNDPQCPILSPSEIEPDNAAYTNAEGIGYFLGGGATYAMRGGTFETTSGAGLYSLSFISVAGSPPPYDGYRCVWRPTKVTDTAPVAFDLTPYSTVGAQAMITLAHSDAEGHSATACAVSNLVNVTETTACACTSGLCRVGITGTATGAASFDFTVTANALVSNTATATMSNNFDCPLNYVKVPGNAGLGTSDFCVMKYEAKNVLGAASVSPYGTPANSITAANAQIACTNLGTGFDLISNPEWMTIARNAENVAGNWSGGVVGTGCMMEGNVGTVTACRYNGNDVGTFDSGFPRDSKARLTLSNGSEIWDLVGNIFEYVDYNPQASGYQNSPTTGCTNVANVNNHTCAFLPDDSIKTGNLTYSLGQTNGTSVALMRGGSYNRPNYGVYGIWNIFPNAYSDVGYRCVFRPTAVAGAPILYDVPDYTVVEDTTSTITFTYVDPNGDAATSCAISNLNNVTVSTACTCAAGVCTVGIRGATNYVGAASFDYTITAGGDTTAAQTTNVTFTAVDDAPVVAATYFTPLQVGVQSVFTLPYTDPEDQATACAISNLVNVTETQVCACAAGVCTVGVTSAAPGVATFDFNVTANAVVSNTATAYFGTCSPEWISVPGNTGLGTNGFCVMKYEARDVGGVATSSATDPLWVSVNRTNARAACVALSAKHDLIANSEWMTIARNIEATASNWTSGAVDNEYIFKGHSDNSPASVQTISNTADSYDSTGNNAGEAAGSGKEQARKFTLSNSQEIWDFAGNVWEFVDWSTAANLNTGPNSCTDNDVEMNVVACGALTSDQYLQTNAIADSTNGIGKFFGPGNGGAKRGGSFSSTTSAGIYALSLADSNTTVSADTGFRCVWRP